ncbi:hypothetical protein [Streptomyces sp. NBC_00986]|uniref:hypothetical protein n=1 Tax=Streptomyces sp. NBC_00986 TaxID=2903702 RepID=UPI00386DA5E5|nr:hypothetical protein OG504_00585 [Streptomyces sp. NBC_00986]
MTVPVRDNTGLFAPRPRTFTRARSRRIRGRNIPDFPGAQAVPLKMATEHHLGQTRHFHTEKAPGSRRPTPPPDEHLMHPEALTDLPQTTPTPYEALKRAGLPTPPRPRLAPTWMSAGQGSCHECLARTNERDQRCAPCPDRGTGRRAGPCHRRGQPLPLRDAPCRRCVLTEAETDYGLDGIRLDPVAVIICGS